MKNIFTALLVTLALCSCNQKPKNGAVTFVHNDGRQTIDVLVDGKLFTTFLYPDTLEKQALYPIYTASGTEITRGYPMAPRPFERVDHGHHVGMWFNFGDVNGVNFWNNSFAVKPEDKPKHGIIKFKGIKEENPAAGKLVVESEWVNYGDTALLAEETTYIFSGSDSMRTIEHISKLTALTDITFTEDVEGMLGIRMDRVFEEPTDKPLRYTDENGIVSDSLTIHNEGLNGKYRNQFGDKGPDVWGKKSPWVALRGTKDGQLITVAVIDNQSNFGYPAWSHARGYGMFSTNNIGGRAFDPNGPEVKLFVKKGDSVIFKHKVIIANGELADDYLTQEAEAYK